ncbi:hypothetical protein DCAR_0726798 [Daucus carota subsp. sativus]|uniref:Pectinesterase inhibitor domain-containing protein n=1 Tax=Daucus carota subsp. sativus TaxID=79200 RepID=A0AAF0XFY3_DAUCS|nr:PREDICTED: cell wall / vacuolar inhibitor of fructosidase 1-like [Daucus carota subsp. sativus]WOH07368.1 hypothetical protein DCAR_0726798 [Daucus carota subsp. sativus]
MLLKISSKALVKFILLLVLLSPSTFQTEAKHETNLIIAICKKTPNYALCLSTLKSNPNSSRADVAGLGYIVVETVKAKSTAGLQTIVKLSRSSPVLKRKLSECWQKYDAILNDFVPEAEQGPPKFAVDGMKGVAEVTTDCIKDFQGLEAPLPTINQLVHDLSLVAASIISNLL